jgi:UDP-2-acetamido-3-amino-2,3-dideoxy-glucuronate N-acetyltransferase
VLQNREIDKVVIATPATTHTDFVKKALLAGKDVYCEKPLCTDLDEAKELVALAEENILMVGHLLHYHPCVEKVKQMLKEGLLGELSYISSHRLSLAPSREEGALLDLAPHDISVLLSLCPTLSLKEAVTSKDQTTSTLLLEDEQVSAHIFVSWRFPTKEQRLTIQGSKGVLVFDDTKPWEEKLLFSEIPTSPYQPKTQSIAVAQDEPLLRECAHFLHCCETRERPLTDGKEALGVMKIIMETSELAKHP